VIVSVIGRGGIGTVYRVRHAISGALAAVKVLGPAPAVDAMAARRLAREYQVLRSLDHPNVVRVYEAGVAEGYSYLAMELVEGLDLRTYLSPTLDEDRLVLAAQGEPPRSSQDLPTGDSGERGPEAILALAAMMDEPETEEEGIQHADWPSDEELLPVPTPPPLAPEAFAALNRPARIARLRTVLVQVADALAYVHANGLVHRDLKPSNIMVDDARRARLMDFGLVEASEASESLQSGRVVGTYRYMSPEQAQGHRVDGRSDLYSLGVILYELLAGAPPFSASDPIALWRQVLHARPRPLAEVNRSVDAALAALAERLLEKNPDLRCQSAREVLAALGGDGGGR
jgi:serine/threonine protein kinase